MNCRNYFLRMMVICLCATHAMVAASDDWPQWRGPNRDGVWSESGIIDKFPAKQIKIRWRAKLSSGYSAPSVAAGRVFVTDRVIKPKQIERVHCFDWKTGKPIWTHSYPCRYGDIGYQAGPRAAVTIDADRAYSLGAMGHLFCLSAAEGTVLWKRDLNKEYKIQMPNWGIAAAPLIEGDLLIVQIGGEGACLVAFDKKTGKQRWTSLEDRVSYSAPIMINQAGKRVLVCWTGDHVVGLNPTDGSVHWKYPFTPKNMVIGIATPVIYRDQLLVTSFYDGALLLRLRKDKLAVEEIWRRRGSSERKTNSLHSVMCTPYMQGDHIYGVDSYGELRCLETKTGDRVWENLTATSNVRWGNIHMVRNGDRMWMFNERGELIIAKLSPKGFHEISRAQLIQPTLKQLRRRGKGVCWTHPAFAYRHVFVRNDEEIVCASLAAE